jgi:N6-L-threonylcarbamoyladenine synthase
VADIAASFQEAVVDVLVEKVERALKQTGLSRVAVVGGLAANSRLRARMAEAARDWDLVIRFPDLKLCTDNAAMIAAVADRMLEEGERAPFNLEAFSRVPLGYSSIGGA